MHILFVVLSVMVATTQMKSFISCTVLLIVARAVPSSSVSVEGWRHKQHQQTQHTTYEAKWESLDSRPLPAWYDNAKFGVFVHWGVFSVPAFANEWIWDRWSHLPEIQEYIDQTEGIDRFSYQDYAHRFDATLFNPDAWAQVFANSGAQHVVLTAKHHEGYCMWDSRSIPTTWNWNVMDIGPKRDLVGELAVAVRNVSSVQTSKTLRFGLYHSLYEWFNPFYMRDRDNKFTTQDFVDLKVLPELYDLVKKYQPDVIWSDGDWEAPSSYWKSTEFLSWLVSSDESPVRDTVVWNDRWGVDTHCKHGGFWNCDDRFSPNHTMAHKFEDCATIDPDSWGFKRDTMYYRNVTDLIHLLIENVAYGGNLLLNVGPNADGTLPAIFVDRLEGMGRWLSVNGEAIYNTQPWPVAQREEMNTTRAKKNRRRNSREETPVVVFYAQAKEKSNRRRNAKNGTLVEDSDERSLTRLLYAHMLNWPRSNTLHLRNPIPTRDTQIRLLGYDPVEEDHSDDEGENNFLRWTYNSDDEEQSSLGPGLWIQLPSVITPGSLPGQHAWVLAISNVGSANIEAAD